MKTEKSKQLFEEEKKYIPGGVNSRVRAFKSVGGDPLFITKGKGSKFWDADGNEYIDYIGSWGTSSFRSQPSIHYRCFEGCYRKRNKLRCTNRNGN